MKNKLLLLIYVITSIVSISYAETIETIDSSTFESDTTYIINKYVELENLENYLDEKTGFWDIYGNAVIALFTVLISTIGAYFIAKKQVYENSKSIQLQVRANNISSARIKWINELRPLMANFLLSSATLKRSSKLLSKYKDDDGELNLLNIEDVEEKKQAEKVFEKLNSSYADADKIYASIRLFLNPVEDLHSNFINKVDAFLQQILNQFLNTEGSDGFEEESISGYQLELLAQEILKEAWEQAKTETGFYKENQNLEQ